MHLWKNYPQKWLGMDWKDVLLIQKFAIPIKVGGEKRVILVVQTSHTGHQSQGCMIKSVILNLSSINLLDLIWIFFAFNVIDYKHNHFL